MTMDFIMFLYICIMHILLIFSIYFIHLFYANECFAYRKTHAPYVCGVHKGQKQCQIPAVSNRGCWEPTLGPPKEQQLLLIAESPPQLPKLNL